jgi:hypothetical protein
VNDKNSDSNFFVSCFVVVLTTGMVVFVGFGSYSTYQILQKLRCEGYQGVRSWVLNIIGSLKRPANRVKKSLELSLGPVNNNTKDLSKRPSNLSLSAGRIPSSNGNGGGGLGRITEETPNSIISVTPLINGDIAYGDEDAEEVQVFY